MILFNWRHIVVTINALGPRRFGSKASLHRHRAGRENHETFCRWNSTFSISTETISQLGDHISAPNSNKTKKEQAVPHVIGSLSTLMLLLLTFINWSLLRRSLAQAVMGRVSLRLILFCLVNRCQFGFDDHLALPSYGRHGCQVRNSSCSSYTSTSSKLV